MELNGLLFSLNEETKEAVITGRTAEALNENGELLIPAKVVFDNVEYLVTEIGESAFDGDEDITALVVEEGVKTIRELAFNWCSSLKTVQLPASITTIENEVFHACAKLVSVVLPYPSAGYLVPFYRTVVPVSGYIRRYLQIAVVEGVVGEIYKLLMP